MPTFLVVLRRSGPEYDLSRPLEERVAHVVEADSEDEVRATFARDPWSESHLRVDSIEAWAIRLDGRSSVSVSP